VPLIEFQARPVQRGVSVKVLRANAPTHVRHAFIATMRSGHRGVFWREWDTYRTQYRADFSYGRLKGTQYALPIRELYGPRISDIFDDPEIMQPVMVSANERLQARLEHHTNRLVEDAR
jgi:hypothetical protein